jgi:DNA polymerase alpha subunit B
MSAAGPFTTTDDLTYAPFTALLQKAMEVRPDCLVLLGPFVDESHPAVAGGDVPVTYETLFCRQVLDPLKDWIESQLEAEATKIPHVVLLPSPKDAHLLGAYPQPPLEFPRNALPEHVRPYIHSLSNPATFRIGGLRVAAASVDTLFLLGQQELAKVPTPTDPSAPKPDRMARLASHVLQQRHLLPLFPTPLDERQPLPVDVTANLRAGGLPCLPEVLLVPSELAPFAKLGFGGVLCVNPGKLAKAAAGGNYALISVHPASEPEPAAAAEEVPASGVEAAEALSARSTEADALLDSVLDSQGGAASSASVKVEDVKPSLTGAAAVEPFGTPPDAPREMMTRAFVEIKKI